MKLDFELFTEVDSSFAARVTVRQKTGQLGLNAGALNRYCIDSFSHCRLYFAPLARAVGIELLKEPGEAAIEIRKSPTNSFIPAKNFLDRYGLDYSKSHRYELRQDGNTGYLFFVLVEELTREPSTE